MYNQNSSSRKGPLHNIKVIDFSTLLPGPYASAILVDLGAEVIRIESPTRIDLVKSLPPLVNGQSTIHLALNRGKKSVAIDLKSSEGLSLAKRLVGEADILLEQFRPGVMTRLGLDYEVLSELNPKLIYCSITGYGQTGVYSQKAGHDINYLALSGIASYSGRKGEGPRLSGVQIADLAGGSQPAVIAILAALFEREHTALGRYLDISMSDGALALNALTASAAAQSKNAPSYGDTFLNGGTIYDYYQSSDGRWLSVGSLEPQFAQRLFDVLGHPEWLKESLQPPTQQAELKHRMTQVFASKSFNEWCEIFSQIDCCVEPVLSLKEALDHSVFQDRGIVKTELIEEDEFIYVASPLATIFPQTQLGLAHVLGQDTDDILSDLGLSMTELQDLKSKQVIKSTKV